MFSNFGRMALICHEPAVCVSFSPRRCLHVSQHEHRGGSNGSPQTPGLFLPRIFPQTCAMGPATGASPGGFCLDPPDPGLPAHPGQFLVTPERTSPPTGRAVERALDTSFCRTGFVIQHDTSVSRLWRPRWHFRVGQELRFPRVGGRLPRSVLPTLPPNSSRRHRSGATEFKYL